MVFGSILSGLGSIVSPVVKGLGSVVSNVVSGTGLGNVVGSLVGGLFGGGQKEEQKAPQQPMGQTGQEIYQNMGQTFNQFKQMFGQTKQFFSDMNRQNLNNMLDSFQNFQQNMRYQPMRQGFNPYQINQRRLNRNMIEEPPFEAELYQNAPQQRKKVKFDFNDNSYVQNRQPSFNRQLDMPEYNLMDQDME